MENLYKFQKLSDNLKNAKMKLRNISFELARISRQINIQINVPENNDINSLLYHKSHLNQQVVLLGEEIIILHLLIDDVKKRISRDNIITVQKVVATISGIDNRAYLERCIKYLRGMQNYIYSGKTYNTTNLIELEYNGIIEKAHQEYNNYLIKTQGPYEFYHTHDDYNICMWNGYSCECACNRKCIKWTISDIDWINDVSLDMIKPIGQVVCMW
ncbi:hypothetical protein [Acanthamoeba polyphaga mimivirus]|uniref:Uncharacterized protein n=1 Tax=Acanthamoeba polyphaga mimivirus TaxID=212035 RepID=A0A2L2DJ70_MIMIV|nr:hypothetical protein [Acanthamoeba polyphaga mimivirus]